MVDGDQRYPFYLQRFQGMARGPTIAHGVQIQASGPLQGYHLFTSEVWLQAP